MVSHILLAVLCGLAVIQDVTTRKIRNLFNIVAAIAAFVCVLVTKENTWSQVLLGFLAAFLSGFFLWKMGAIKAGDAKFLWTVGIIKGVSAYWWTLAYTLVAGGIMALGILLWKRDYKKRYQRLWAYLKSLVFTRTYSRYEPENPQEAPFALPMAVGCLVEYLLRFW